MTSSIERRAAVRVGYAAWQRVNFNGRDGRPTSHWVRCHNLSADGFSFWSPEQPAGELSLELGQNPGLWRIRGRVRHVTSLDCLANAMFLVGCGFDEAGIEQSQA